MEINYLEPSFEMMPDPPDPRDGDEILKYLEKIGRICYKSEDKITDDSAKSFMERIFSSGHHSILEHYRFSFAVSPKIYRSICVNPVNQDGNEEYINALRYINYTDHKSKDKEIPQYVITGNIRAFNNLMKHAPDSRRDCYGIERIMQILKSTIPTVVDVPEWIEPMSESVELKLLTRDDLWKLPADVRKFHNWYSVHFIMDRSISHQTVRHRDASFAQESTRYCNYSKKGYQVILPRWMPDGIKKALMEKNDDPQVWGQFDAPMVIATKSWCMGVEKALESYNYMIHLSEPDFKPQDLKGLIPDSLKTEIIVTSNENEWEWIYSLRTAEGAYPDIRILMTDLMEYVKENINTQYADQPLDSKAQEEKIEKLKTLIKEIQEDMNDEAGSTPVRFLDAKSARD